MPTVLNALDLPSLWANCVNQGRIEELVALYDESAVLIPTFLPHAARTREERENYFTLLSSREDLSVTLHEKSLGCMPTGEQGYVVNGAYDFLLGVEGVQKTFSSRFTFVLDLQREAPILHHHSSQIPEPLA